MKITFLGTGTSQGVPVIACDCEVCNSVDYRDKRTRTSLLIEAEGKSIVIDTGPDFRNQMLRERVKHLDAVLFTHEHKDHTAGLDDVRPFNFRQRKDLPVYGRKQVLEQLKQEFAYVFAAKKYPGVPMIKLNEINGSPFEAEGLQFQPINVLHHKLPVYGFRIGDFTYITDVNHIPDSEKDKIRGSQVVVLSALQREGHISHFTLQEAIDTVKELEIPQAYFIHMSHRLGRHAEIEKELPNGMNLSFDGLQLEI